MKNSDNQLFEIYDSFCTFLKLKDYKTGNGTMYPKGVLEFLNYSKSKHVSTVKQIDCNLLKEYACYLGNRPNQRRPGLLSGITINHYLFGVSLFLEYLLDCGYVKSVPAYPSMVIHEKNERPVLTIEDIHCLLDNCKTLRETAIISLAYGCGMRRQEIVNLNVQEVMLKESYLIVRNGKNSKRREIPLSNKIIEHLGNYMTKERGKHVLYKSNSNSFLLNRLGKRMSGANVYDNFKSLVRRSNDDLSITSPTLHDLRHAIANHMMENGAGIEFIKEFLGHSLIDTAQLYAIKQKRKL